MLSSDIPTRFTLPWAVNAAGAYIRTVPTDSQIGIQDGAASFNDGFVPDNFTAIAGGGVPPFGQDFNGILNAITKWDQWVQAGGPMLWNLAFSTAIGGYPAGAKVDSNQALDVQWISVVDNNTTNPDDPLTSANWVRVGIPAGMPVPFLTSALPYGYWPMNGTTIGAAGSNADLDVYACLFLYVFNWLNFSNTQCPILTSAGVPTTRGANGVADFFALKQLTMPNAKGLGMMGVDTMGGAASTFLAGVPVTIGNTTTPGSIWGENLHALITAELAAHTHVNTLLDSQHAHTFNAPTIAGANNNNGGGGGTFAAMNSVVGGYSTANASSNIAITNASAGGGGSHNTVERNMGVFWGQRL